MADNGIRAWQLLRQGRAVDGDMHPRCCRRCRNWWLSNVFRALHIDRICPDCIASTPTLPWELVR